MTGRREAAELAAIILDWFRENSGTGYALGSLESRSIAIEGEFDLLSLAESLQKHLAPGSNRNTARSGL